MKRRIYILYYNVEVNVPVLQRGILIIVRFLFTKPYHSASINIAKIYNVIIFYYII